MSRGTPVNKLTKEFERITLYTPNNTYYKDFITPPQQDNSHNEHEKDSKYANVVSSLSPIKAGTYYEDAECCTIDLDISEFLSGLPNTETHKVKPQVLQSKCDNAPPSLDIFYSTYIDINAYVKTVNSNDQIIKFELSSRGMNIEACHEIFPRFFWISCKSVNGDFVTGIRLNKNGEIVRESGLMSFQNFLQDMDESHIKSLTPLIASLILLSCGAFPSGFNLHTLVKNKSSSISFDPFQLLLAVSRESLLNPTFTLSALQNQHSTYGVAPHVDENFYGADLVLRYVEERLVWELIPHTRHIRVHPLGRSRPVLRQIG
jgi:hypothetical protein